MSLAAHTRRSTGRLLRWFQGSAGARWGDDPGDFDPDAVRTTIDKAARFFGPGRYFGLEVHGLENIPAPPAMLISNHSGGTTIPDVWGFGIAWYRHFGTERPLHPLAHEMIMSTRATGEFFSRRGVLRGTREIGYEVLHRWQRDLMVMPGGDVDTWRPYRKRYQVCFAGRTGYARLALKTGTPIVPVANAGAHETLFVLTDGKRVAEMLRLKSLTRASIFPVHFSLPWGLTIGPWPHLPWPAQLRYRIGEPIAPCVRLAPGEEPSDDMVRQHDETVRAAVQALLDELKHAAQKDPAKHTHPHSTDPL